LLEARGLTFQYPQAKSPVFSDLSATFREGEVTAIVGSNGSGKSTLGLLLAGLYKPTAGEIRLTSPVITSESPSVIASVARQSAAISHVGIVFQDPSAQVLFETVREDITFVLRNFKIPEVEWQERIETATNSLGLNDLLDANGLLFSGGMKQRVAIACMVALRPQFIVFDEATSSLDAAGVDLFNQTVADLKAREIGVILITNRPEEIARADTIVKIPQ
jgi:energy-coupling factor transporter ATP-binding protein EcfA2